ncbi:MAG: hypothetical protein NW237_04825 [Cyanobacteriota bacterium]|nr:hypothetical protein [Cyanobacteriota bacterium]
MAQRLPVAYVAFVLLGIGYATLHTPLPSQAQTPAPDTYQPGFFQPVARVNPQKPLQIEIENLSGSTLEYGLSSAEIAPVEMEPGETSRLEKLALPAYINISTPTRPPFSEITLRYDVQAEGNRLKVQVTVKDDVEGDRVLNIDEAGAVYIY